jgi:hypothetical protein
LYENKLIPSHSQPEDSDKNDVQQLDPYNGCHKEITLGATMLITKLPLRRNGWIPKMIDGVPFEDEHFEEEDPVEFFMSKEITPLSDDEPRQVRQPINAQKIKPKRVLNQEILPKQLKTEIMKHMDTLNLLTFFRIQISVNILTPLKLHSWAQLLSLSTGTNITNSYI